MSKQILSILGTTILLGVFYFSIKDAAGSRSELVKSHLQDLKMDVDRMEKMLKDHKGWDKDAENQTRVLLDNMRLRVDIISMRLN